MNQSHIPTEQVGTTPSGVNSEYDFVGGESYHSQRRARGVSLLLDALLKAQHAAGISLGEMHCLSLGAGTAAPQEAMCQIWASNEEQRFPTFHLTDYSRTQLDTAEHNLAPYGVLGETIVCDLTTDSLPFADGSIDFVDCTHVLHHLTHGDRFCGRLTHIFSEVRRVLKPTGRFALTSMSPTNCRKSRWFALAGDLGGMDTSLDPGRQYAAHCPRMEVVIGRLIDQGLLTTSVDLIRDEPLIESELYFDPQRLIGLVKEGNLAGSSFFVLAKNSDVWEDWLESIQELIGSQGIERVMTESEKWRKLVGQAYFIEAMPRSTVGADLRCK